MTAKMFIDALVAKGFSLRARGGKLVVRGTRRLELSEREYLHDRKSDLMRELFSDSLKFGMRITVHGRPARVWQLYPTLCRVGVVFDGSDWPNFYDSDEVHCQGHEMAAGGQARRESHAKVAHKRGDDAI